MKTVVFICTVLVVTNAAVSPHTTHFVRTPAHDSAIIRSDRFGNSFAYSVLENRGYTAVNPLVSHVTYPVALSYMAPESPNVEVKTAEMPETEVKSTPVFLSYVFRRPYVWSFTPNVETKTAETPEAEVKTVHGPSPFVFGTPQVFHFTPKVEVKSAELPETEVKTIHARPYIYGTPYVLPVANVQLPQEQTQGSSDLTYVAPTGPLTYPITSGFPFNVVPGPASAFAPVLAPAVAPVPAAEPETAPASAADPEPAPVTE